VAGEGLYQERDETPQGELTSSRLSTNPSSDRVGRLESLNDVVGREARVSSDPVG